MATYRAIVSIEFDDDDLAVVAEAFGIDLDRIDPTETLNGALDNLEFGDGRIEQLFRDGHPTIARLSGGIMVEVNDHE